MLALALLLDAALGEPDWMWRRLPHPVVVMGRAIGWWERRLNRGAYRQFKGTVMLGLLITVAGGVGAFLSHPGFGGLFEVLGAAVLVAQRSLIDHVRAVADGLDRSLEDGRRAVAMIVGRDTADLDESGVARAAIESAAENFSDGIVAPAFWFLVAGLPGILIYKMINTADSTVGYRNARYEAFGWASAKVDDLVNWVPARLSAAMICLVGTGLAAWAVVWADARLHRSPNAGWPEAAVAGSLEIALSGPRAYEGRMTEDPFVNPAGRRTLGSSDVRQTTALLWRAWAVLLGISAFTLILA
ncbi:MAG: adenosylcobinamide-phosphate synthase CbiB [Pseudomonadota bacterium]